MWPLLSLLFTSTLVAAAPRHHGLQHRQWHGHRTSTIVSLSTKTLVASSTSSLLLWPTATADTDTPSTSILYAQPSATPDNEPPSTPNGDSFLGNLPRMSAEYAESICHICHQNNPIQWPLPASADGVPMPMPIADNLAWTQPSLFERPESTPNKLTIVNYCPYDLYFKHLKENVILQSGSIAGNGGKCEEDAGGTVMKVGKDMIGDEPKLPVQIEYGASFYDLSLIDCLARSEAEGWQKGFRTADTSACAGHEHGLQLSNPGSKAFQCAAGVWCDDQAYFYEENLCKHEHPNTSGDISKGLTMEFCAGLKPITSS